MAIAYSLAAGIACALMGFLAARTLVWRVEQLEAWLRALLRMETALQGEGLPIRRVLEAGAAEESGRDGVRKRLTQTAQLLAANPSWTLEQAWGEASSVLIPGQRERDKAVLDQCFLDLGRGAIDQRRAGLRLAQERLRQQLEEARKDKGRNGRLYQSLGWLSGLALVLMLL